MNLEQFSEQNKAIRQRTKSLYQRAMHTSEAPHSLLPDALEELQTAIEELRVAEEELRQQNEELLFSQLAVELGHQRYKELLEFAPDGYLVTDLNSTIQESNQVAARLLNVPQQFLMGKPLTVFVRSEDRSEFYRNLLNAVQTQKREWQLRLQPRGQSEFDALVKIAVASDITGQLIALRWLIRDLTSDSPDQTHLLQENFDLQQRTVIDTVLRRISDRVRKSLDEQQILHTAMTELKTALHLLGCDATLYNPTQHLSRTCCSCGQPDANFTIAPTGIIAVKDYPELYHQLFQGQAFQFCQMRSPHSQTAVILVCPIIDPMGFLGELWCFNPADAAFTTEQVYLVQQVADQCAIALRQAQLHQKTQSQMIELRRLNHLKNDFLSAVSHELRTPLTNIKMAIQLLHLVKSEEQRSRYLQILQTECDREIHLITDLLELQQLETTGKPAVLLEAILLHDWLPTILAPFLHPLKVRQQVFTFNLPEGLPPMISDRESLRRILVELLRNARKYTPDGGEIEFRVSYTPPSERIIFILKNQSEIPAAELPHIFEKFYRPPQGESWRLEGMGLGLSLVKRWTDCLQGAIAVESQAGWTTFSVSLPLRLEIRS